MSTKPMQTRTTSIRLNPAPAEFSQPSLAERYTSVRRQTLKLSQPLSEADMTIQADDFVSPGKWHLAHTTWFFEEFFLNQLESSQLQPTTQDSHARLLAQQSWQPSAEYRFLFNSYYETIGNRQVQGKRGLITRPGLEEVLQYRAKVDAAVVHALHLGVNEELQGIIELGLHHEQQHQELFLMDTLYNFAQNPIFPAYQATPQPVESVQFKPEMVAFEGGLHLIGHDGIGYGFDNEFPQHKVYLEPYKLASSLVSNEQWIAFIEDGGYHNPLLWLADGWKTVQAEQWEMPLYWIENADIQNDGIGHAEKYRCMTLAGLQAVNPHAPVCHISYFEADAFARWAGKRLPTESEWEVAAGKQTSSSTEPNGHFADDGRFMAEPPSSQDGPLHQLYGDVWEWTASPYTAYPGFKTRTGAVGEYNGKFMNGQYVLRGGSCATPFGHIRLTYRNFFYPHQRWQFGGLRLAE